MKKVAMMQPTFLPWLGYFELILKSDIFVFLDDFQFVHRSYHQRNRIFVSKGHPDWITVPVDKKKCYEKPLNETWIQEDGWRQKMWRTIESNYSRTSYFSKYAEPIRALILEVQGSLARQNILLIRLLCDFLGKSEDGFQLSSSLFIGGKRSERIYNLLRAVQADVYLSAQGSFEYMLQDGVFPVNEIDVLFQDAILKPYPQYGSTQGFVPYLSVLDALFNVGAERTRELIMHSTEYWLTWDEMVNKNNMSTGGGHS